MFFNHVTPSAVCLSPQFGRCSLRCSLRCPETWTQAPACGALCHSWVERHGSYSAVTPLSVSFWALALQSSSRTPQQQDPYSSLAVHNLSQRLVFCDRQPTRATSWRFCTRTYRCSPMLMPSTDFPRDQVAGGLHAHKHTYRPLKNLGDSISSTGNKCPQSFHPRHEAFIPKMNDILGQPPDVEMSQRGTSKALFGQRAQVVNGDELVIESLGERRDDGVLQLFHARSVCEDVGIHQGSTSGLAVGRM